MEMTGMFVRGDYIYTVYLVSNSLLCRKSSLCYFLTRMYWLTSGFRPILFLSFTRFVSQDKDVSRITRSCKKDLSSFPGQLTTFTVAKIQCLNSINGEQVREVQFVNL